MSKQIQIERTQVRKGNQTVIQFEVTCPSCGSVEHFNWNNLSDLDIARKNLSNKGYDVRRGKCPKCPERQKKEPTVKLVADNTEQAATPISREQRANIRELLVVNFDDERGCYENNYSDQKIGEELNVPWAHVAEIREAAFGPILIDPDIEAMKSELETIRELCRETERECRERIAEVRGIADDVQRRLAKLEKDRH